MVDLNFKDHFSNHAGDYAKHRPTYPESLFDWLASICERTELVWDCATGNGQAALALAERFDRVIATDASEKQIGNASNHPKVEYRSVPAERSGLEDGSVDLVTVAQAYHWFDCEAFCEEARRVCRPGGVVALWSYGRTAITPEVDAVVERYYEDIVGVYWPPERAHVEDGYMNLPFSFPEIITPEPEMEMSWTINELIGYLTSWSSTQRYMADRGSNPMDLIEDDLKSAWGSAELRKVRWPLAIKAGRVTG